MKNILIIGSGGREHALAWKARQSHQADKIFVAPGNAGTALELGIENVDIDVHNLTQLVKFAKKNQIALTIVGPEAPLAAGIVDLFSQEKLLCFGPHKIAAQLESSKLFCKRFLEKNKIPTASYQSFTDLQTALAYIQNHPFPLVIKADGLAAGKGVVIAHNKQEAIKTLEDMLANQAFGKASQTVIIESFLRGEEASFIVVTDGKTAIPLATSQDHKTRDNGDTGPNTGGMGAYSPAPVITPAVQEKVMQTIIYPTLKAMAEQHCAYVGFLYAGLMITPDGDPYLLEFNCRLGDPETQPILMRLKSDLVELCSAVFENRLHSISLTWDDRPALGVVMASKGYPFEYPQDDIIHLPAHIPEYCKIFHAGTVLKDGVVKTAGGRVLCVTALGNSLLDAQQSAYSLVEEIDWGNQYYRTDIGYKAITPFIKE